MLQQMTLAISMVHKYLVAHGVISAVQIARGIDIAFISGIRHRYSKLALSLPSGEITSNRRSNRRVCAM